MSMRESSGGGGGGARSSGGAVRDLKAHDAPEPGARIEYALLAAVVVVTSIAVLGTAGAKVLARWTGAE